MYKLVTTEDVISDCLDDMLTPCDDEDPLGAVATASLLGENDDSMINLVLIKNNEKSPEAIASWDSSVHDAPGLNCPTATNDRVYAILKVSVMLNHPPGIELVLRKRICLCIIKSVGIGTSIMKLFSSGPSHTDTGAMYEVVTGIPKLEGMFRPPKIPSNHPSFVEVEENEDVVEKFKEGIRSVRHILALDQVKQEACLKEKLVKSGQLLHSTHTNNAVDETDNVKFNQIILEDTAVTSPPIANRAMHIEHNHNEDMEPDLQVIQNSPEEGEHSTDEHQPISNPLSFHQKEPSSLPSSTQKI